MTPSTARLGPLEAGLCIAAACVAPTLVVFAIIWVPGGAASGLCLAATQSLLERGAAPEYQGRVMALFSIAWIGTTPVGAPIMGWVIDDWSARVGMEVGAASALIAGAYLILAACRAPTENGLFTAFRDVTRWGHAHDR